MIEKLSKIYVNINLFHKDHKKKDLTRRAYQTLALTVIACCTIAASGDLESIQRLNAQGLELNVSDYDRRTLMHLASAAGNIEIVKYLIEKNVRVNALDRWGATPLNYAKDPVIVDLLLANGAEKGTEQGEINKLPQMAVTDDQYRFYYAALECDLLILEKLILQGVKINGYDYDGRTALNVAASEGKLRAVKYLLRHGADPSHRDSRNNDAMADALRENHGEVAAYLKTVIDRKKK